MSKFLKDEELDKGEQEIKVRTFSSINNANTTLTKLHKLLRNVTVQNKHKKTTLKNLYTKRFGSEFV